MRKAKIMLVLCLDHVGRISAYVNSKLMLYRYRYRRISVVDHYAQEKGKVGNNTEQQMRETIMQG